MGRNRQRCRNTKGGRSGCALCSNTLHLDQADVSFKEQLNGYREETINGTLVLTCDVPPAKKGN